MRNLSIGWPFAAAIFCASMAKAESLEQVLSSVYQQNPRILSARASLRALDEDVARANSGYRPRISGSAHAGYQKQTNRPRSLSTSGSTTPRGYGLSGVQSVFNGFQTHNRVKSAKATVRSGRAALISLEQEVLLDAITAYMDVLRDAAIVRLQQKHLMELTKEVSSTRRRKIEGQVTRTDLSQAIARRASADSRLRASHGSLRISRANFELLVGRPPSHLSTKVRRLLKLPRSLPEAIKMALKKHPNIVSAREEARAAGLSVQTIRGELLPSVQLELDYAREYQPNTFTDRADTLIAQGRVRVPIYSGGEVAARVRQAKHTHNSRLQNVTQVRQQVTANVEQSWAQMLVAQQQRRSVELQVRESRRALDGVRREERFGQRTVIEVLNAADTLLNSAISLVTTDRNLVVSSYSVLAAVGRLNMDALKLIENRYDPKDNYRATHRRWGGLSIKYADGRREYLHAAPAKENRKTSGSYK